MARSRGGVAWRAVALAALAAAMMFAAASATPVSEPVAAPPPSGPVPVQLNLEAEWQLQYQEIQAAIAKRDRQPPAEEALNVQATVLLEDRDALDVLLRRTEALLADVKRLGAMRGLAAEEAALGQLKALASRIEPKPEAPPPPPARGKPPAAPPKPTTPASPRLPKLPTSLKSAAEEPLLPNLDRLPRDKQARVAAAPPAVRPAPVAPAAAPAAKPTPVANPAPAGPTRQELFLKVCAVRRRIALANPLLNFSEVLFLKCMRRRPGHICDQFFGSLVGGSPDNGIFILSDPFGTQPILRNVLENSVVQNGRLKGTKLEGGSFLGPDLSWDGRTIVFAYTECKGGKRRESVNSREGIWDTDSSYHIFRVNVDGSNLAQLTDGPFNDFDPCWLPSGRIACISERRGGYGRCHGRPVPTYTLHSMNPDGTDLVPLSYHETNEWQPSVNNDGLVVYSRWDYVDRGDCIAHHPWVTTPDGRDCRVIQGNYPVARNARPDAELDVRAIPGSRRYVATAGPHHGQSFGSFVVIDPDVEDNGAMGPLKRLTPDNGFPETQGGQQWYGTAWPLSDTYYLAVYGGGRRKDAVYLLDAFGNHILIHVDAAVECLSPMPLRPRARPPVIPHRTEVGKPVVASASPAPAAKPAPPVGLVTCINVYEGLLPWPEGTRIKALRIIQLFPKATANMDYPHIGRWAESLARGVLGTVPVEADGSACFFAPAGKTLYFQALDENGLAVQSMQSDAYVHPGERLTCRGCHEHAYRAPEPPKTVPMALRRPPSAIKPEQEGAYPVLFPKLVQPVLDRHCVACHEKDPKAPQLSGAVPVDKSGRPSRSGWSQSYTVLSQYAFGRSGKPPSRSDVLTVPGEFGARASKLYQMLQAGHHDVKLPADDLHRLVLWIDSNSNFFGAYHDIEAQGKGTVVMPDLE